MVIDNLDNEITQVEHKAEQVRELAKVQVDKLKANKAEWQQKQPEEEGKHHEEEDRKNVEQEHLDKEVAAKMHTDKAKKQLEVCFAIFSFYRSKVDFGRRWKCKSPIRGKWVRARKCPEMRWWGHPRKG